jgi:PAS domain S-box-containing protein
LETAAPPSILVDQSQQAIHFSESAGRYLQLPGGAVTSAIVRLVRPELQEPLRQALTQALQQGQESFTAPIAVAFDGTPHLVHLLVYPVQQQPVKTRQALVIFIDTGPVIPAAPVNGAASALDKEQAHKAGASEQIVRLRTELAQAHDQLQRIRSAYSAAAEQQYTANEELQAINEEYRSIAEELQSSQEELQSLNEELRAVNTELKDKLREVSQAHSDLQNLMAVAEVGTLFLDQALRVRRFTAPVTRIFNITASDRGRSITDLTHQLTYANLVTDARQVMRDLTLIEQEIRSTDGDTYLVRLRPYRTVYHKIDGVVVTFVDITKHKAAEAALRASEERFRALADNIAQLAWMTDPAGAITWYNKRWYEYTGTTFADVQGWGWQTVHHPDHVARVVEKIRHCFATGAVWEDLFPLRSKTGEYRWFLSHAFPIRNAAGEIVRWFGTNTDVTEQRETEAALRRLNETLEERVEERTEQVRDLASKLTMSEQEERRRIAQILHDDLQQLLYGIQMRLDLLVMDAEAGDTERLADYAKEAYSWLGSAIRTTRQLTVDISPPVLEGEGVGEALQWLATQMAEINELQVKIVTAGSAVAVNGIHQDMRVLLFQVVRELLFNVVKHAATDHATVTIGPVAAGTLSITVEDDGCGFDVAAAETRYDGGFGLFSIRERLRLFGGWMQITSAPGKGTCITLAVPIAQMQWDSETVRQWDSEAVGQ